MIWLETSGEIAFGLENGSGVPITVFFAFRERDVELYLHVPGMPGAECLGSVRRLDLKAWMFHQEKNEFQLGTVKIVHDSKIPTKTTFIAPMTTWSIEWTDEARLVTLL